ncbi:MAG: TonB-dependent receptor [Bacteroidia bacterium]
MMKRKVTLFLAWLLIFCATLHAQTTLQGSVYDRSTGRPLPQVRITIEGLTIETLTDRQGHFDLDSLAAGVYYLTFSRTGYDRLEREVVVKDTRLASLGVSLAPVCGDLLRSATQTAQGFARDPLMTPSAVSSYDRHHIGRDAPRTLPEALSTLPGLWLPKTDHGGGGLILRGLAGSRNLVFIDGIRLNTSLYGLGPEPVLGLIDPYALDRVEVLHGAGAVLYGAGVMGGVVQAFTREVPYSDQGLQAHGRLLLRYMAAGMEQAVRGELDLSHARAAFAGSFGATRYGDLVGGRDVGQVPGTGYDGINGDARLRLRLSDHQSLTFAYQYAGQNDVAALGTRAYDSPYLNRYDRRRQLAYVRLLSYHEQPWTRQVQVTAAWQGHALQTPLPDVPALPAIAHDQDVHIYSASVEVLSLPSPYWHIRSGVEYYHEQIATRTTLTDSSETRLLRGLLPEEATAAQLALYSFHTLDLLKLRLSFGGRLQGMQMETSDSQFEAYSIQPRVAAGQLSGLYPLNPHVHLVSSFQTSMRPASIYDRSSFGPFELGMGIPGDSLAAERSFNAEIGLKARTAHFSGSLMLYRNRLRDMIDWVDATYLGQPTYEGMPVYQRQNIGEAFVQGIEAALEVPVNRQVALYGGLIYARGRNLGQDQPLSRIPPLNSRLGLRYQSRSGLWSKVEWRYAAVQSRLSIADIIDPAIDPQGTPGWNVVDLHVGYDFAWGYATLGIRNLLDDTYYLHGASLPEYGRSVLLAVQIGF